MPGFGYHQRGDILADLAADQQPIRSRQIEPQRPRNPEPTGSFEPRDVAGQTQLVGYPAANLVRMHISGQLLFRLRLGEPDRFGHLQRRSRRLDLLQPGNPINPRSVRHHGAISGALRNTLSQAVQHIIQPTGLRIDVQIRSRLRNQSDCHASDTTDQH